MGIHVVVGNQTLDSKELRAVLENRASVPHTRIHVLVPQTPLDHYQVPVGGHVQTVAEHQLAVALEDFSDLTAVVTGEVGPEDPLDALKVVSDREIIAEVIVSTFPPGASRWLGAGLPKRIQRKLGLSVTHVVGHTYDEAKRAKRKYAEVRNNLGLA